MENNASATVQREEITIKFGKGLVGEPFMSKNGVECVQIRIPNADPADKRLWETCVVPARIVHENQFGKGVWMKLPANGTISLRRSELQGLSADCQEVYTNTFRKVSNQELKYMLERYKQHSITDALKQPGIAGSVKNRQEGRER